VRCPRRAKRHVAAGKAGFVPDAVGHNGGSLASTKYSLASILERLWD
jgi:hypothetical protein